MIGKLAQLRPSEIATARVELAPAVELDLGRLVGNVMIVLNDIDSIAMPRSLWMPPLSTPAIRGNRMTVYSVLGRIENGETVDDILSDNLIF